MFDSPLTPALVPHLSAAILSTSAVTRLGLACPDLRLRERAAETLARTIVERLSSTEDHQDQLTLGALLQDQGLGNVVRWRLNAFPLPPVRSPPKPHPWHATASYAAPRLSHRG